MFRTLPRFYSLFLLLVAIAWMSLSASAQSATTLVLTAGPNPAYGGSLVGLTATAKRTSGSGTPTGTVTFYYYEDALGTASLSGGVATLAEYSSTVPFGSYAIHAVYSGDGSDSGSTSNTVTVTTKAGVTSTVLTASPSTFFAGRDTFLTATVTSNGGPISGSVSFYYGDDLLNTGRVHAGLAQLSASSTGLPAGTYDITAQYGGSSLQVSSKSAPIAVTIQADGNPTQPLSDVTMELPLTEGSGTTAHDISGKGNNATFCTSGTAPVWASYGLAFSAPEGYDSCLDTPLKTWGSFFVYACPYAGAFPNSFLSPTQNLSSDSGLWGPSTTTDGIGFSGDGFADTFYSVLPTIVNYAKGSTPTQGSQLNGACHVYAATLGSSADHLYVDGVEQSYVAQDGDSIFATTSGHYQIGCIAGCTGQLFYQGVMSYVVVGSPQYTSQQVAQESDYILQKIAPRDVGNFPYAGFTSQSIVLVGDSLTANRYGTTPAWFTLLATKQQYTTTSLGVRGMLAADMAALWTTRENGYMSSKTNKQYCHIWAGTNDIATQFTPADAWQSLIALGQECVGSGGIPIVSTMISRVDFDTEKNELNALIRAGWQQAGFAAVDDLAAYPELGADGAYANQTYFYTDGIHLTGPNGLCSGTATGYAIVCHAVSNSVNLLDGSTASNPQALTASGSIGYNRFTVAAPASNMTLTLPDCTGLTGQAFQIKHAGNLYTVTIGTTAGQTINGNATATIADYATASFVDQVTDPSTGGCSWTTN